MSDITFHWRIIQDGVAVASSFAPSQKQAHSQSRYYGVQYADEGPIVYEARRTGTRWKRER